MDSFWVWIVSNRVKEILMYIVYAQSYGCDIPQVWHLCVTTVSYVRRAGSLTQCIHGRLFSTNGKKKLRIGAFCTQKVRPSLELSPSGQ